MSTRNCMLLSLFCFNYIFPLSLFCIVRLYAVVFCSAWIARILSMSQTQAIPFNWHSAASNNAGQSELFYTVALWTGALLLDTRVVRGHLALSFTSGLSSCERRRGFLSQRIVLLLDVKLLRDSFQRVLSQPHAIQQHDHLQLNFSFVDRRPPPLRIPRIGAVLFLGVPACADAACEGRVHAPLPAPSVGFSILLLRQPVHPRHCTCQVLHHLPRAINQHLLHVTGHVLVGNAGL
mmetsp:Transcript_18192/g.50498  ORF Transcript_18192/g.50498 Transcript_18192/m.50498 type:complete len:235 (+) Transcript_18192:1188-1892(+)